MLHLFAQYLMSSCSGCSQVFDTNDGTVTHAEAAMTAARPATFATATMAVVLVTTAVFAEVERVKKRRERRRRVQLCRRQRLACIHLDTRARFAGLERDASDGIEVALHDFLA